MTLDQLSAAATDLLPCPFCGGDGHWSPTYIDRDTPGTVECANGCGATVIASGSKAERIAAWNTRTGQLVAVADDAIERLLWHVEQCLGPISRETCEVVGDDDYSILRHNFKCVLAAKGTGGE